MVLAAEVVKEFSKVFSTAMQHRTTPRYTGTTIDNNALFDSPGGGGYSGRKMCRKMLKKNGERPTDGNLEVSHQTRNPHPEVRLA